MYLLASSVRRLFDVRLLTGVNRLVRIKEYSDKLDSRNKRAQQAKPLALHLGDEKIHTSNVASGMAKAVDQAEPDRVGASCKDNRNGRSGCLSCRDARCASSRGQHRHFAAHQ